MLPSVIRVEQTADVKNRIDHTKQPITVKFLCKQVNRNKDVVGGEQTETKLMTQAVYVYAFLLGSFICVFISGLCKTPSTLPSHHQAR